MWDGRELQASPVGLVSKMLGRPLVCIQPNGTGTGQSLYGHSTAVVVDGTQSQVKDATGQYQDADADANRNGWRQQTEVSPAGGFLFVARMKTPAALPVAASIGRWIYGMVDAGFEDANPSTVQGLAFRFDRTVADTVWQCVCRGPAGENSQATTLAFSLNTRFDFAIELTATAATFYANDLRVAQFTTDLPTSLLRLYGVTRSNGSSADVRTRNGLLQVIWGTND